MGDAGRVVLERVDIAQFRADTVSHHQAVCSRAIVVGCGETLQVQTSAAAGCQDHGFGVNQYQGAFFQIVQNRADAAAVFVRLAQYAHHFKAGKVAVAQDARHGRTACTFAAQHAVAVRAFGKVESHAQADQPADGGRRVGNHLRHQFFLACVVAAFDGVVKVLLQAVFRADCRLNAAFGHHGIAVTDTQLVRHNHARACLGRG